VPGPPRQPTLRKNVASNGTTPWGTSGSTPSAAACRPRNSTWPPCDSSPGRGVRHCASETRAGQLRASV